MSSQDLYSIISSLFIPDKKGLVLIKTSDFAIKFDTWGNTYNLYWIKNFSSKFKGTDIFKELLKIVKERVGEKVIIATGIRGDFKGEDTNGYYTMMRWGFIPEGGISFINKILGTNYEKIEKAFNDSNFWINWKANGVQFDGEFDMSVNSLSWKVLNHQLLVEKVIKFIKQLEKITSKKVNLI